MNNIGEELWDMRQETVFQKGWSRIRHINPEYDQLFDIHITIRGSWEKK